MSKEPLAVEYISVETEDADDRLLRCFEILLNDKEYKYEERQQEENI